MSACRTLQVEECSLYSEPPKSGKSWKLGSTARTFGLTVPEFPLSSASPAMTDCDVVGRRPEDRSIRCSTCQSDGVYVTAMSWMSKPELKT